jgi:hypothetical protein
MGRMVGAGPDDPIMSRGALNCEPGARVGNAAVGVAVGDVFTTISDATEATGVAVGVAVGTTVGVAGCGVGVGSAMGGTSGAKSGTNASGDAS